MFKRILALLLCVLLLGLPAATTASAAGAPFTVEISADDLSHEISDTMYGIFIEDINNGVEGGLNANLVRNNSFEYLHNGETLSGWEFDGEYTRATEGGIHENNPSYIVLPADGARTIKNYGFCEYYDYKTYDVNEDSISSGDMGIKAGEKYVFSAWFKNTQTTMSVYLENKHGEKLTDTLKITLDAGDAWQKFSVDLSAAKTDDGILVMEFEEGSAVTLDFVCLYPENSHGYGADTWKYTSLRQDLYDALANLHPSFVRFPGGCVAEGDSLENLFNWKDTIGAPETRKQNYNIWQNDVIDYNNSYMVGYHEYFQLCSDLGAEPVPILNVGLICQARCGYDDHVLALEKNEMTDEEWETYLTETRGLDPEDTEVREEFTAYIEGLGMNTREDFEAYLDTIALRPGTAEWDAYVQDILDLIEYANGDTTTEWGALRAQNGHPASFGLEYIGLGNENWGEVYFRNLEALKAEINAVYPEITIISSSGPVSSGEQFDESWAQLETSYSDTIVDEHYYQEDNWYLANTERYDSYDRDGAKVFLGEYAATSKGVGTIQTKSNLKAAMSEAAYMTGLERNGDVVVMASYAPIFAKINAQEWTINMIWFDSHNTVLTPSYYTQMLFMNNTGSRYVDTELPEGTDGMYQSVTVDEENEILYIKLVNTTGESREVTFNPQGFGVVRYSDMLSLSDRSSAACNEVGKTCIVPKTVKTTGDEGVTVRVDGYSVNVIRITYGENRTQKGLYDLPRMPETRRFYTGLETALIWGVPTVAAVITVGTIVIVRLVRRKRKK